MQASIVDLRYRMKEVLLAIDRGETVTVLYRGKAKAQMTPIAASQGTRGERVPPTADQEFFGLWRDRADVADPARWLRRLRQPRAVQE